MTKKHRVIRDHDKAAETPPQESLPAIESTLRSVSFPSTEAEAAENAAIAQRVHERVLRMVRERESRGARLKEGCGDPPGLQ